MEINLDVEDVREWLRQYVGSGWSVMSTIALSCYLAEIDTASPHRLLGIVEELGVSDQIVRDLT